MTVPLYFPAAECCWCCVAMVERGDMLGHTQQLCPFPPCDWCEGVIAEFSDDDHGRRCVRVLVDLPHLGIAAGSEIADLLVTRGRVA